MTSWYFPLTFPIDWSEAADEHPAKSHRQFPYYFDDEYGFCFGPCGWTPPTVPTFGDLAIYYGNMGTDDFIDCWCSRWDVQNYNLIIETWLKESDLQTLKDNMRIGAVGELYKILGKPRFYDKSWTGANTIKMQPIAGSNLSKMRGERVVFPKNITTGVVKGGSGWIFCKIEATISGNQEI